MLPAVMVAASGLGNENLQACVDPLEDTARTGTNVSAQVGINLFNLNIPDRRVHYVINCLDWRCQRNFVKFLGPSPC